MTVKLPTKLSRFLLYKLLLYKHYYKFMFLHKPLCNKYKENTLVIFNMYICRSCFLLYTGVLVALFQMIFASYLSMYTYALTGIGAFLTLLISYPVLYKKFSRRMKDFVRFFDGYFLCSVLFLAFKTNIYAGIISIFGFIFFRDMYNKLRKKEDACKGCEKLSEEKTCEGYIYQKYALLALDEDYSNIIMERIMEGRLSD